MFASTGVEAVCAQELNAQTNGGLDRAVRIIESEKAPQGPQQKEAAKLEPGPLPVASLKNSVGLTFDLLPGTRIPIGSKISFRVGAEKPGYVVIIDVDATGRTTQVYPNALSEAADGKTRQGNRLAAGAKTTIPATGSKSYEFSASPPSGVGMAMAIFSETPLQVIDLPDVPPSLVGRADAADFVRDAALALRFLPSEGSGDFKTPNLSFEARFYSLY